MRYATVTAPNGKPVLVRIKKDGTATPIGRAYETVGLDPMRVMLSEGKDPRRARAIGPEFPIKKAKKYHPPITYPSKVVSTGANYRRHIKEVGVPVPKEPLTFAKYPSSLVGHKQPIVYSTKVTKCVDYENELIVVVGRRMKGVKEKDALDYVLGYTICNDVSARDHQFTGDQFTRCKSLDTFTPMGPWIVDTDEIPDPQVLDIKTRLDGKLVQNSNTADMMFPCAEILSYLCRFFTLEPGDCLTTGTPEGVGFGRKPPLYMKNGSVLESEISKIGVLVNPVKTVK